MINPTVHITPITYSYNNVSSVRTHIPEPRLATDVIVLNTEYLSITCSYQGRPAPNVTWSWQGEGGFRSVNLEPEDVGTGQVTEYLGQSQLVWDTSESARRDLSGVLTCTGNNGHGLQEQRLNLFVQCMTNVSIIYCLISNKTFDNKDN